MTVDLSAFYFDIRKDALYCDPYSSLKRRACLAVLDHLFRCTVTWLAPMLSFTAEEAWLARDPAAASVHLESFPAVPASWRDDALAEKWRKLRNLRRVVTGALELERAAKRIGSSLEAAPMVYVADPELFALAVDVDLAELCITSAATLVEGEGPPSAFRLDDVPARRGRAAPRRRPQMCPFVEDLTFRRARSAISRRDAARRAGAARMGRHAQGGGVGGGVADASPRPAARSYAWGPLSALGLAVAAATGIIDQASKLWLLDVFDLADRGRVAVTSFIDLVVTWNAGISYGLLQQNGLFGAWALLAFKMAAVVFLWIWLARASSRLTATALGLIIGGALGNAIDRLHWPGVMDFVLFHIETAGWSFRWYVFNLADVAIVAGVAGLLYDSLRAGAPQKRPDRG